jgi:secreted trypsin-like serine protease
VARLLSLRSLMPVLAVAVAAFVATVPGAAPAGAVAHGELVPEGRYRYSARLTMTGVPWFFGLTYTNVCSGALVAPSWVITAGHCFHDRHGDPGDGPVPYPTTAIVGVADVLAGGSSNAVAVTEVRRPGAAVDIALVRLARPVHDVPPVAVATSAPTAGMTLRLTGWGAANSLLPLPSTRLRTGLVTVSSITAATVGVRGLAPAPDTSACLYDSGAPYVAEGSGGPVLVAVESDGPPCPHAQEETTARVDTVADWIAGTTRERSSAGERAGQP